MQPAMYWLILFLYWDQLQGKNDSNLQLHLALAVGAREACYFPITLLALVYNPSFLLIDLTFDHSRVLRRDVVLTSGKYATNLFIWLSYGITPEKLVLSMAFMHMLRNAGSCCGHSAGILSLVLTAFGVVFFACDMCAIAALVVGITNRNLPHALAVGYALTTLSGFIALPPTLVGIYCFTVQPVLKCLERRAEARGTAAGGGAGGAEALARQLRFSNRVDNVCCFCFGKNKNDQPLNVGDETTIKSAWDDPSSFIYTRHLSRAGQLCRCLCPHADPTTNTIANPTMEEVVDVNGHVIQSHCKTWFDYYRRSEVRSTYFALVDHRAPNMQSLKKAPDCNC
jgi:hypothetical protein